MYFNPSTCSQTIEVFGVGEIGVPVSINDVKRLIAQAKPLPLSYGLKHSVVQTINISWSIQRDFFDIPKKSTVFHKLAGSWIEQVVRKKNIDLKAINGRCCLNQIVIYESGNHYIQCEHKPQNKGHFGSVSLQIPVEKGHRGGRLTIKNKHTKDIIDLSYKSDEYFYVSFIEMGSEHWIEPITDGFRIELEYSLFWTGNCSPTLPDISTFLTTLTKLNLEFRSWQEKIRKCDPTSTKLMVIGLEHNYDPKCHSFDGLLNEDQSVANLICSSGLVDVHLARLTRRVSHNNDSVSHLTIFSNEDMEQMNHIVYSATDWRNINNQVCHFENFDIQKEAKYLSKLFDGPAHLEVDEDDYVPNFNGSPKTRYFHRSVLILWLKSESCYFDLHYRFDHLLQRMESERIPNRVAIMRKIVSNPVWEITALRVCRLLNLCTVFKTNEEALLLLQLMADKSVGIPSDEVANSISRVECKLIGWKDSEDVINKLLVCRPSEQLSYFATFAQALVNHNSFDGFHRVSNQTWNLFIERAQSALISEPAIVIGCIKMLLLMEEYSEAAEPSRIDQFISCIEKWPFNLLCRLIIDLRNVCVASYAGQILYLKLCNYVALNISPSQPLVDHAVDLLSCYLFLNQEDVTHLLMDKICTSVKMSCLTFECLLEKLAASFAKNMLPASLVNQLLDACVASLGDLGEPELTWEQTEADFPDAESYPSVSQFLKSPSESTQISFPNKGDAEKFVCKYFSDAEKCLDKGYSATATVTGRGRNTKCVLIKTTHALQYLTEKLKIDKEKIEQLRHSLTCQKTSSCSHYPNV